MNKSILPILVLVFMSSCLYAQDTLLPRDYKFGVFNQYDLRTSSVNGHTLNKVLHDAFRKNVVPKMGKKSRGFAYGLYSFATTYMTMVWSHEIGHALRAKQVGGVFKIHNGELPIPHTTMHLPNDISYPDEVLSVTGGFEVNHITSSNIQQQFISNNGGYSEDLAYAFANRMMFSIYTSLIIPINPEEKENWIETAGDPVHCILPVFKNHSNDQVFLPDSSVNPDLVKFYKQSALLGILTNLLDPHFYSEVSSTFGDPNKIRKPKFLVGNPKNGWTYGTMFNMSPLGYELYLTNYIHLNEKQFSIYGKYGNPFKNNGMGIRWNNMAKIKNIKLSSQIDYWDQDIYGKGIAGELEARLNLSSMASIDLSLGYKTEGYKLGRQIDQGLNLGFGIVFHASYY